MSVVTLLLMFAAVSALAVYSLMQIEKQVVTIHQTWLTATQVLGDLKSAVSEFRIADAERFLAEDPTDVIQAEYSADRQADTVQYLLKRFKALSVEAGMHHNIEHFEFAWSDLLAHHSAWIAKAAGERISPSTSYSGSLQQRYETAQVAANAMVEDFKAVANVEVRHVDTEAGRVTMLVSILSAAAGVLAVGLLLYTERHIARPLGAITSALLLLARGDRTVRVPELHRRDEIGAMAAAFEVFRQNAVALGEAQERAEALARHDVLTGLANRRLLSTHLEASLATVHDDFASAVMLIDLDRFKPVNDLYGHAVGDVILREVGARLRGLTQSGALVSRLGGDEFAVILPVARTCEEALEQAATLASRIVDRLGEPIAVDDVTVLIGATIGISLAPRYGGSAAEVLRTADIAMYRAKRDGRGTYRFFEPEMDAELRARAELEADLRAALAADGIEPYYQPIVDLADGRVVGFEILARWRHERRGFVPPDVFIPLVEQIGGLTRLTESLLRRALTDAASWNPTLTLAINVSPCQIQDSAFPALVAGVLMAAAFQPHRLEMEVTEAALMDNLEAARASIEALRRLGICLVLDDFGTGYSSLSHLREVKFDKIKIDRSFILNLTTNSDNAAIVDAVLSLSRSLGLPVVAEGIETEATAALLVQQGCAFGQGYLFSPAVPATEVQALTRAVMSQAI